MQDKKDLYRPAAAYSTSGPTVYSDIELFMIAVGHLAKRNVNLGASSRVAELDKIKLYVKFCEEELNELKDAVAQYEALKNIENERALSHIETHLKNIALASIADGSFDLTWVSSAVLLATGLPVNLVWQEGTSSNLAKINPETGRVDKRDDGKVIKPLGWKPPDFLSIVKQHLGES